MDPDPELVEEFRGQILEGNDSDVPSISVNASVVPMGSPPCRPWLGPPPFVPPPSSGPPPFVPPPFVPPPVSLPGQQAEIPKPDDVGPLSGPLFLIYIASGSSCSSASEQEDQPMDMSNCDSVLSYAMDVVTSDDPLVFPIGDLHLPESGPFESGVFELGPFKSSPFKSGPIKSDLEDISNCSGQVVHAPSSLLRPNPSSSCYTAASFADVPDEWLA